MPRFPYSYFLEINAHSLFSKYFSESGKLVANLFQKVRDYIEDDNAFVFILIDEVESLTTARKVIMFQLSVIQITYSHFILQN